MPRTSTTEDTSPEPFDERVIDAADRLLRAALRGYTFRLAIKCDTCGAWISDPEYVRRHRGPVCHRRVNGGAA
ncbi:hypothetical protein Rrhod_4096 [Rhodococcus rhodnii LMG 5362]|uniref:C2H2-type domain-containing protein n=1 Tax=Rhodococcus rhodnii LMG 5362 TaxID=1273125 RepID=R7WHM1_9NOCA|nr:hypothetical protein Rrhod_4096 [Rhodococcus rhodnii LMG 5362]